MIQYTMSPDRTGFIVMSDDRMQFNQFIEALNLPEITGCDPYPATWSENGIFNQFDGSFGQFPRHSKQWKETEITPGEDPMTAVVFCLWTIHQWSETEYFRCRVNNENFGSDDRVLNQVELLSTCKNTNPEKNKATLHLKMDAPWENVFAVTTTNWRLWRELLQVVCRSLMAVGAKRA
jgi:Chitin binding domain.